jgi:ribose transport system ATP-binding protein
MNDLLEPRNITKLTALDDVSISFRRGKVHAIVGENGTGRSTLIKMISGAETCPIDSADTVLYCD